MNNRLPKGRPSTIGGIIYLCVLALGGLALLLVGTQGWRIGAGVLGGAMLLAAGGRASLSEHDSGMLKVRGKVFDVAMLTSLGVLLVVLAIVIPNQPG